MRKPKYAETPQEQADLLTDKIWDLVEQSQRYAWKQLHCETGVVYNLLYPGYTWKFFGSLGK